MSVTLMSAHADARHAEARRCPSRRHMFTALFIFFDKRAKMSARRRTRKRVTKDARPI